MNSNFRSDILPIMTIAFVIFCGVAVVLSLRAQERDNSRYMKLKKLPTVTRIQRAETQSTRRINVTMEGSCVVFVKRDMLASQAPILYKKQIVQNQEFLRQLKNLGFNCARYTNELESWNFVLP